MSNNQQIGKRIYLPVVLALVLIAGMYIGSILSSRGNIQPTNIFSVSSNSYDKIHDIMEFIEHEYVDSVDIESLRESAIEDILSNLDPHSSYIPARNLTRVNEELNGNFEGIGVQFRMIKDTIVLLNIIPGGPSEKVGLKAGDRIVLIENDTVAGVKMNSDDIVKRLKGKRGTEVNIGIYRKGVDELIPYTIIRDVIPNHSVDIAYMANDSTGYIKLAKFSNTSYNEVHNSILRLKTLGMKQLIFDLRGNSGGYMNMAIYLADDFLTKDQLIVYTEGDKRRKNINLSTERGIFENEKLVILIDENTASASEIIAGAVQDNDRGLIVGRRSFGKGLVQEQVPLADGSAVRLTVARYHTPSGRSIQKPYENGMEDYQKEYFERYSNGELLSADSIKINDSTEYFTSNGRIVYGGGGIMPDVFIPISWDKAANYYNSLVSHGFIYQFAYDYTDENRKLLSNNYTNANDFIEHFKVSDALFNQLVQFTKEKGMDFKQKEINRNQKEIKILLRAYIGRNLFDNKAFYPIYHTIDPCFEKAMTLINTQQDNLLSAKKTNIEDN